MRGWIAGAAALMLLGDSAAEDSYYKTIVDDAAASWIDPEPNATPEQKRAAAAYVIGNTLSTMFHEFGHALVSEFDINVLGKEEDAVDSFADVTMIADEKDPVLDALIIDVVRAWFDQGWFENADVGDLADEHSMNEQRGYATVCRLYGASPERFGKIADEVKLPEGRRDGCEDDYITAYNSWVTALGDNYLDEGEEAKNKITITWDPPSEELEPIAEMLKSSYLIDAVVEQMQGTFRLPHPITVQVSVCGEDNAYWSPGERTLTLCYEIAEGYRQSAIERRHGRKASDSAGDEDESEEEDDN